MVFKKCCLVFFIHLYYISNQILMGIGNEDGVNPDEVILRNVMMNYSKNILPMVNNKPVDVKMSIYIANMVPLEVVDMHYTMDIYMRQYWTDYRLAWRNISSKDGEITVAGKFYDSIWTPDPYFPLVRNTHPHVVTNPQTVLILSSTGDLLYKHRITAQVACIMSLTNFPFDMQECEFSIESYAYNSNYLHLTWIKSSIENAVVPPDNKDMVEFSFHGLSFEESNATFEYPVKETFDQLNIKLLFKRNHAPYIIQMYIPCFMVVSLSWVGFWIDYRSAPARVSLGITTVLTMVTLGNSIRASLPFTQYSKSLDYYVMVCLFYVFAALLEFAVVGITDKKWTFRFKEEREREGLKRNRFFRPERKSFFKKKSTVSFSNITFSTVDEEVNKTNGIDLASLENYKRHSVITGQSGISNVSNHTGIKNRHASNIINYDQNDILNLTDFETNNDTTDDHESLNISLNQVDYKTSILNNIPEASVNQTDYKTSISNNIPEATVNQTDETAQTFSSPKLSSNIFIPSAEQLKDLQKTYKNAQKFQPAKKVGSTRRRVESLLINRQIKNNDVHVLDRIMKKIFPISFIIFNVFYFTFSLL